MRLKNFYFYSLLIFMLCFLVACGSIKEDGKSISKSDNKTKDTIKVEHKGGMTEVSKEAKKIVALEFSFVDALAAIDIKPVGIADDNKPDRIIDPLKEKVKGYKSVGTRKQPNLEEISKLKPELIIADSKRHKGIYKELSKIAPTLLLSSFDGNYKDNIDSFKGITKALNKEQQGKERLEKHESILKSYKEQITLNKEETVLPAVISEAGFLGHPESSYVGQLLTELGFKDALTKEKSKGLTKYFQGPYLTLNSEVLTDINPKRMFIMVDGANPNDVNLQKQKQNKVWETLDAVKKQQVHIVNRDVWARSRGLISSELLVKEIVDLSNEKQ